MASCAAVFNFTKVSSSNIKIEIWIYIDNKPGYLKQPNVFIAVSHINYDDSLISEFTFWNGNIFIDFDNLCFSVELISKPLPRPPVKYNSFVCFF